MNINVHHEWALWPWQGSMDAAVTYQVNVVNLIGQIIALQQDFNEQANVLYALADARRLDGLIIWKAGLVTLLSEQESDAFCRRFGLPVVTIEGELAGAPCVTYSNYDGVQRLMTHLIEAHGYQRIGFVGMFQHHIGFQERYRGYHDALRAHGLIEYPDLTRQWFPDEAIREGLIDDALLHAYLRQALEVGVEALICVTDSIAGQAMRGLRTFNVRVPREVAVSGFDGFTEGRALTPPVTTVDPGWYQLGYQAMATMVRLLAGEPVSPCVTVPAQVLVRQSCGCLDASVTHAARRMAGVPMHANADLTQAESGLLSQEIQSALRRDKGFDKLVEGTGEALLKALQYELKGDMTGQFLVELETLLQASMDAGGNVLINGASFLIAFQSCVDDSGRVTT